jgi:hypothetical protein
VYSEAVRGRAPPIHWAFQFAKGEIGRSVKAAKGAQDSATDDWGKQERGTGENVALITHA